MTALRKRTQAQRDAINTRAAAYPRPLSLAQVEALEAMGEAALYRCDHGTAFGSTVTGRTWQSATILSLAERGLCSVRDGRFARITAAGKRELGRHRR